MYDCTKCGACCAHFPQHGIDVLPQDDEVPLSMIELDELGFRCMAVVEGTNRCVALQGTVGMYVRCGIYNGRPTVCEQFKPGDTLCNSIRRSRGLEVVDVDAA